MNPKKSILIATLMAMAPSMVFAQNPFGNRNAGVGLVVSQSPGQYTYQQLDQSKLNEQILNRLDQSRSNDRLYVTQTVSDLNDAFKRVQSTEFQNLLNASLKSTSQPISYVDYMTLSNALISKGAEISNMIGLVTKLPDALKTSSNSAQTGNATVTLPGQLVLDFSTIVAHFNQSLANLNERTMALTFNVQLPNGALQSVKGINADGIDQSNLVSQEMLDKIAADIRVARREAFDPDAKNVMNGLRDQTATLMNAFINNQGTSNQWRFVSSQDAVNKLEMNDLIEAFWLRSFIRAKYGVSVGPIGIDYQKKIFNLDRAFSPDNLIIRKMPAGNTNMADLNMFLNVDAEAVKTYDGQSHGLNQPWGNPYNMIAWTINKFKGKWNQAAANVIVVKMVLADLEEEKMILTGGGLRQMHDIYHARYQVNPVMKEHFKVLARAYEGMDDDNYADTGIANSTSMRGLYASAKTTLDNVLARQEIVDRKQQGYDKLVATFRQNSHAKGRSSDLTD